MLWGDIMMSGVCNSSIREYSVQWEEVSWVFGAVN